MNCVCCGAVLTPFLKPWLQRCPQCGLEASRLGEARFNGVEVTGWDEDTAAAMTAVRETAASRLLERLKARGLLKAGHLLDVGCGPGWFLRAAAAHGLRASGIEPDATIARRGRAAGLDIRDGLFPLVSSPTAVDIVSFNDVFEHMPDPALALRAAHRQLVPGGLLLLNLPSSRGFIYRVARRLARIGVASPLERMWQKGFESPHLYYYAPANLIRLVTRHGFDLIDQFPIETLSLAGLWDRIRAGQRLGRGKASAIYLAALMALPLLKALPSDIVVQIYSRR